MAVLYRDCLESMDLQDLVESVDPQDPWALLVWLEPLVRPDVR